MNKFNISKEDKKLLLIDLCGRLPYNQLIKVTALNSLGEKYSYQRSLDVDILHDFVVGDCMIYPYLRSSKYLKLNELSKFKSFKGGIKTVSQNRSGWIDWVNAVTLPTNEQGINFSNLQCIDYLNEIGIDWRGLIDKNLAIELNDTAHSNP
jgi:hypothetical protein